MEVGQPLLHQRAREEPAREVRGVPGLPGLAVPLADLELRIFRPDESYSATIAGSKWGQTDQEYSLRGGRLGLWEFGFDWDQMPHVYSTNAQFLATEVSRGVYALPTPRPPLATYNAAPTLDEIAQRWDQMRTFFRVTPTPDLDLNAEYTRIRKTGDRPFSMAFGSPGEQLLPRSSSPSSRPSTTSGSAGPGRRRTGSCSSGTRSRSSRTISAPCRPTTPARARRRRRAAPPAIPARRRPARGQTSLPPNNMANTLTLNGGVNLPWWRTRMTGNFS